MRRLRFIDLFSGIGGTRLAFQTGVGGDCVFAAEIDRYARHTYQINFPRDPQPPSGDLRKIHAKDIPAHDVLLASPPCQPFSKAGIAKKKSLGHPLGFGDRIHGTLFFEIARILQHHRPAAFLMENVKTLLSHDRGHTFAVMTETLKHLGYRTSHIVLDARPWVPQHRERVFLAGLRNRPFSFQRIETPDPHPKLSLILHTPGEPDRVDSGRFMHPDTGEVHPAYTLKNRTWACLQAHKAKHRARGNGFGYTLCGPDDVARTLSARYGKDGSEILIRQPGKNPRRLTPRECARLMNFPDHFDIPVSDTQAYRQFGNAVVVGAAREAARQLGKALTEGETKCPSTPAPKTRPANPATGTRPRGT